MEDLQVRLFIHIYCCLIVVVLIQCYNLLTLTVVKSWHSQMITNQIIFFTTNFLQTKIITSFGQMRQIYKVLIQWVVAFVLRSEGEV